MSEIAKLEAPGAAPLRATLADIELALLWIARGSLIRLLHAKHIGAEGERAKGCLHSGDDPFGVTLTGVRMPPFGGRGFPRDLSLSTTWPRAPARGFFFPSYRIGLPLL